MSPTRRPFGVHVSIAGGVEKAPGRAGALGCDAFQLFVANPRSWSPSRLSADAVDRFVEAREKLGLGPVVVHQSYLPNLASPERALLSKSRSSAMAQYRDAARLGADLYVLHPGSRKEAPLDAAQRRAGESLRRMAEAAPEGPPLLVENTAGGGGALGVDAASLGRIVQAAGGVRRIGLCLDTAHAWAAGVDLRKRGAFARFVRVCEQAAPLRLLHFNDSRGAFDSRHDRHAHIGLGAIGEDALGAVLRAKCCNRVPAILETPVDEVRGDADNLAAARELQKRRAQP